MKKLSLTAFLFSIAGSCMAESRLSYNYDIKPLLSDRCFYCHGFDEKHREAELRLDTQESAFRDIDGVTPIVPGHPEKSEVWRRISTDDPDDIMPTPKSHLTLNGEEKELIRRWIEEGAEYETHWSFVRPARPETPKVVNKEWVKNPIDAFILARLEAEGLSPSPEADPVTLRRRLSLDLTGLPTTEGDLLSSPAFGERWTFPWLSASRYADSNGFQGDPDRFAYPWRDYMIRSLNENKPQDQLITELLAGDLLPNSSQSQIIATAFNRNHLVNNEGGALDDEILFNYYTDRLDATATTFLGLTLACAQCHDHKYDPLTHKDYYSFMAFFSNMDEQAQPRVVRNGKPNVYRVSEPVLALSTPELDAELAQLTTKVSSAKKAFLPFTEAVKTAEEAWMKTITDEEFITLPYDARSHIENFRTGGKSTPAEIESLRNYYVLRISTNPEWVNARRATVKAQKSVENLESKIPVVMVMKEKDGPARHQLHSGGAYDSPTGDALPAAIPGVLGAIPTDGSANRLDLAHWLVSAENPLTARVLVNRAWQEIFGTGIVATPEDFGSQGALPSHPELLDWLAVEFIESGWDFKHLIDLITSSATYRQSSVVTPALLAQDPANRLLARGPRYRMPSPMIRDQALSLSGLMSGELYGPPVFPPQPDGLWKEVSFGKFDYPIHTEPSQIYRRSIYTFWRRTLAPPNMFDESDRQICSVKPSRTNTPDHALAVLNDPIYTASARALAQAEIDNENPTEAIFRKVTQREPAANESAILLRTYQRELAHFQSNPDLASLRAGRDTDDKARLAALTNVALMILNLDETLTKE